MDDIAKIGDKLPDPPPTVFELIVYDHVQFADPKKFGLLDRKGIDPAVYYITSGDAVEKAKALDRDLWKLAGSLRRELLELIVAENECNNKKAQALYKSGTDSKAKKGLSGYEKAVWCAAGQCRKLINALKKARGDAIFLETDRLPDRRLIVAAKNPRQKEESDGV